MRLAGVFLEWGWLLSYRTFHMGVEKRSQFRVKPKMALSETFALPQPKPSLTTQHTHAEQASDGPNTPTHTILKIKMNAMFSGINNEKENICTCSGYAQHSRPCHTHTNKTQASNAHMLRRDTKEARSGWRLHPGVSRLDLSPF